MGVRDISDLIFAIVYVCCFGIFHRLLQVMND
jgi:hypothetical protein